MTRDLLLTSGFVCIAYPTLAFAVIAVRAVVRFARRER
jgi:hypothetical protein